jgi:thioredoxin-related protein
MNLRISILCALALSSALSVWADEQLPVLKVGTDVYSNVTVLSISATDVYFTFNHGKGMANAKLKNLSPDLQRRFHYQPATAGKIEQKRAQANAKHQRAVVREPAPMPPHETRVPEPAVVHASDLDWSTDFTRTLAQARAGGKVVLLDFTGSDWCPWCIKFDREVLQTDQFATYARNKLELVLVDFPHTRPQDNALKEANQALANQYHVSGFPTFVLVNDAGEELGRQVGYAAGGPGAFIAVLEKFNRR